jgi:hypothetical protein
MRSVWMGLAAAAVLMGAPATQAAVCTPAISFTESLVGTEGQYTVSTGDLCGFNIIGVFIDNNQSTAAFTFRSGWGAEVISRATWNGVGNGATEPEGPFLAYFDFGGAFFATGPDDVALDIGLDDPLIVPTIGSFESFYGPGVERVNMYYLTAHFGLPIQNFQTEDQFFFSTLALASDLHVIAQGPDGSLAMLTPLVPTAVPEPLGLALLGFGVVALTATRRRP